MMAPVPEVALSHLFKDFHPLLNDIFNIIEIRGADSISIQLHFLYISNYQNLIHSQLFLFAGIPFVIQTGAGFPFK